MAEWLVLAIAVLALVSIVWSTLRFGISPMPSSRAVTKALLTLLSPTQDGAVHELGAGWGTLAFAIARHCPRARVIAHEGSLFPFAFCWLRSKLTPRANLELRFGDFMKADLSQAAGVVTYLWTGGMQALAPKFEAELKPGAFVLSHTFEWRGRTAVETHTAADLYRTKLFRYVR